jgi:hypothetical protein
VAIFLTIMGTLLLGVVVGFVGGVAYGVQQEERAEADRQRTLRSLKRIGNGKG